MDAPLNAKSQDGRKYLRERMHIIESPPELLTMEQFQEPYFKFTQNILPEKQVTRTREAISSLEGLIDTEEHINMLFFQTQDWIYAMR